MAGLQPIPTEPLALGNRPIGRIGAMRNPSPIQYDTFADA